MVSVMLKQNSIKSTQCQQQTLLKLTILYSLLSFTTTDMRGQQT